MTGVHHSCGSLFHSKLNSFLPVSFNVVFKTIQSRARSGAQVCVVSKMPNYFPVSVSCAPRTLACFMNSPIGRRTHVPFYSSVDGFEEYSGAHVSEKPENEGFREMDELELLGKPSPVTVTNVSVTEEVSEFEKLEKDDALAPFLKFFKARDSLERVAEESESELSEERIDENQEDEEKKVFVEYYEPKPGDLVVGVVVSGNENKLDVNVGADLLGTMLTKEVLPLYDQELPYLLCDLGKDAEEFMIRGKMGIVHDEDAICGEPVPGRPVVETGTVLFAEVLGRTLSGRPLLSTRRLFRRVAWHRVRQVGRRIFVQINRIDESNNCLIISEREAWEILHLQEGTLLEGTVKKIFPYGAQVRIGETNRSGLLHISNITRSRVTSVSDLLAVDEKVKVLVVKSMFPDKISLSIVDLESEPGLFVSNKEKVFSEAEKMARKYRERLPAVSANRRLEPLPEDVLPFDDEARLYANWNWFKFEQDK